MSQEELKQRLIELLEELIATCECSFGEKTPTFEQAAKFLIANGVTIRERGEWIGVVEYYKDGDVYGSCRCSVCGEQLWAADEYRVQGMFCPHCGADMRGGFPDQAQREDDEGFIQTVELANDWGIPVSSEDQRKYWNLIRTRKRRVKEAIVKNFCHFLIDRAEGGEQFSYQIFRILSRNSERSYQNERK